MMARQRSSREIINSERLPGAGLSLAPDTPLSQRRVPGGEERKKRDEGRKKRVLAQDTLLGCPGPVTRDKHGTNS